MGINLLVQNTIVHNFLRIPQSTSTATVHSSNGIKSFFYSNNDGDFFLHRWNFRLNTICRTSEMWIDLLNQKTIVHNFLRIPQSTFPLLQSTV